MLLMWPAWQKDRKREKKKEGKRVISFSCSFLHFSVRVYYDFAVAHIRPDTNIVAIKDMAKRTCHQIQQFLRDAKRKEKPSAREISLEGDDEEEMEDEEEEESDEEEGEEVDGEKEEVELDDDSADEEGKEQQQQQNPAEQSMELQNEIELDMDEDDNNGENLIEMSD